METEGHFRKKCVITLKHKHIGSALTLTTSEKYFYL